MPLTKEQIQLVINIDSKANQVIHGGGNDRDLLLYVQDLITKDHELYSILESGSSKELDLLYDKYEGFYLIIKLLEQLAECSSRGIIPKDSEAFVANWVD